MRVVIQRVSRAKVCVDGAILGAIDAGFCVLVGIEEDDAKEDADWLAAKIAKLRVFNNADGKMNADLAEIGGRLLVCV